MFLLSISLTTGRAYVNEILVLYIIYCLSTNGCQERRLALLPQATLTHIYIDADAQREAQIQLFISNSVRATYKQWSMHRHICWFVWNLVYDKIHLIHCKLWGRFFSKWTMTYNASMIKQKTKIVQNIIIFITDYFIRMYNGAMSS